MEALSVYKKKYHVDYGNADYYKKLKISALFNFFQDVASLHAENLGLGVESLQENQGVTWVLVKILVQMDKFPNLNEEITVETWPQEPKKLEFERDFIVRDVEGNVIGRAISSWVIMDIETREIRKTELFPGRFPPFNPNRAIEGKIGKIKAIGPLQEVYQKVIGYSDIDINGHLNNSKYIDYITDCFSIERHGQYTVDTIQVSYISEALAGDKITFYKDISTLEEGVVYVEGADDGGGKTYFKACIKLRQD